MLEISVKSMTYPNGYTALRGIELQFSSTGLYMIVGESGSGKSTLVKCISGMMEFDGELKYHGEIIDSRSREDYRRDNVGYIFQDYKLFGGLSAVDNVVIGNEIAGRNIDREHAYDELKFVGLEKVGNKKTKLLSGGEKQRVAIVRTIAKNSNIIVADEPTGNLDSKNSRTIMSLLKEISHSRLVLVVTHNLKLAEEFGDRIIKLCDGKIAEITCGRGTSVETAVESNHEQEQKPHFEEVKQPAKSNRMGARDFFKLAFLRNGGAKLIATTFLTLVICIIAISTTMIAGLNKINLAKRHLTSQDGYFAKTHFMYDEYHQAFIYDTGDAGQSYYIECPSWYIEVSQDQEVSSQEEDVKIEKIGYCMQLGDSFAGVELLCGNYPQSYNDVCIPVDIAKHLSADSIESLIGQTVSINTGVLSQEFVIKGVFENYGEDTFLNNSVVIYSMRELLYTSTAENYTSKTYRAKKNGNDIVVYNAERIGLNVANGEVVLSPFLYALASMTDPKEIAEGKFSFIFRYEFLDKEPKESIYEEENVIKTIAHVDTSLEKNVIVLSDDDYRELIEYVKIKYVGIVFDYTKHNLTDICKEFEAKTGRICYISGNYMHEEFESLLTTILAINIKIMLPIAIVFWILGVLCMYIMLKNLIMANKNNLLIMKFLGIKKRLYFIVNCTSNAIYLITVAILAVVVCACLNMILANLNLLLSVITRFVGWEFLSLILAMFIAFSFAVVYLNKVFVAKL